MFNWFQRLLPRKGDFFGMFEAHGATLVAAAAAMTKLVDSGKPHLEHISEIEQREHEADDITRRVLTEVRRTFLTPFDRGAITSLIAKMDDAIDEMHSTAVAIDLYELRAFRPEMKDMVAMISEAAKLAAEATHLLRDISRNGSRIHDCRALAPDAKCRRCAGGQAVQSHSGTQTQHRRKTPGAGAPGPQSH